MVPCRVYRKPDGTLHITIPSPRYVCERYAGAIGNLPPSQRDAITLLLGEVGVPSGEALALTPTSAQEIIIGDDIRLSRLYDLLRTAAGVILQEAGVREDFFVRERNKNPDLADCEVCGDVTPDQLPPREAVPGDGGCRRNAWRWDSVAKRVVDDPTIITEREVALALLWKKLQVMESFDHTDRIHRIVMGVERAVDVPAADRKALTDEWKVAGRPIAMKPRGHRRTHPYQLMVGIWDGDELRKYLVLTRRTSGIYLATHDERLGEFHVSYHDDGTFHFRAKGVAGPDPPSQRRTPLGAIGEWQQICWSSFPAMKERVVELPPFRSQDEMPDLLLNVAFDELHARLDLDLYISGPGKHERLPVLIREKRLIREELVIQTAPWILVRLYTTP